MVRWVRAVLRQFWGPAPAWPWVLLAGLGCGFIFGVALVGVNERYRIVEVLTFSRVDLPKPVTPPPPGMVWARVMTTGYCPCRICCGENARGVTASGVDVRREPFGYATDQARGGLLPMRTVLDIPGYGHALVDDTGGAMRQSAKRDVIHIDLRFREHEQARRWGRRWLWIAVPEGTGAARLAAQRIEEER